MVMSKSSQVAIVSDHSILQDQRIQGGTRWANSPKGLISAMAKYIRHCVECSKCLTRYLIGFSPYPNGSYLVPLMQGSEEWILYCSCCQPPSSNRCSWGELKMYAVCSQAHDRGYGRPEEIVPINRRSRSSG